MTETKREQRIREQEASLGHNQDAPPVPPGVRTFDPRRLRRHNRAKAWRRHNADLEKRHREDQNSLRLLGSAAGKGNRSLIEAQRTIRNLKVAIATAVLAAIIAALVAWLR